MTLLQLAFTFFYIGLFTIGGGQVAITLMYQPIVEQGLLSPEEFYAMVAVSESTPGPIGINMATYIGCELYGILGGIVTTFATVLPSLIIILIIAKYFEKYKKTLIMKSIFTTVRPVSAGLVAVAAWNVIKISIVPVVMTGFAVLPIAFFIVCFGLLIKTKISPIIVIILGGIFGVLFL